MNISERFIGGGGASVSVLNVQTFDTSGTWVKPALAYLPDDVALIELWGGGGGGIHASSSVGNHTALGGGGGAYLRIVVPLSSLAATQAVIVGAGGTPGTSSGGNGGDSSFAGFVATGGRGGYRIQTSDPDFTMGGYVMQPLVSLYTPGAGGFYVSTGVPNGPARRSTYGGSGGEVGNVSSGNAPAGTAPGGGGGANSNNAATARGGLGASGRVRVRIMRGLNQWEVSEGPL